MKASCISRRVYKTTTITNKNSGKQNNRVMDSNNTSLTLKLLMDTKENKVLFAEAGKESIDFLFSLLALPIGTVTRLLTKQSMVGCIGSLYSSVEQLDETYIVRNQHKTSLLSPKTTVNNALFLTQAEGTTETDAKKYYRCSSCRSSNCRDYVTDTYNTMCPQCQSSMDIEMNIVRPLTLTVNPGSGGGGFVKGVVTYTVMDDLSVMPMSTISSITMLNKLHVKDIGSLEEKHVNLDIKQGLKLLKASLQSKTVLTDVFLSNKYN